MINILIEIYTIDQNIGRRIHEAYRKAILATLDDAENFDELIAEIESTETVLTASGNLLQMTCWFCRFCLSLKFDWFINSASIP